MWRWAFMLLLALGAQTLARAERYLTVAEAQKVCFSNATHFEEKTFRLTPDQIRAIEKQSGIKVRVPLLRVWIAREADNPTGVLFLDHVLGKHELIDYAVAVSVDGKVKQVEILEYRESHGGEVRGGKWRGQFRGKSASSALRLNGDIYNISGATMSCRHVTEGVRRVLASFEHVVRPALSGQRVPNTRNE